MTTAQMLSKIEQLEAALRRRGCWFPAALKKSAAKRDVAYRLSALEKLAERASQPETAEQARRRVLAAG